MDSLEAFKVLAEHADQHHEYIVGKIGQEVVAATVERDSLETSVVLGLSDDDYDRYTATIDDQAYPTAEDPYTETWLEFSNAARELFGDVDGYTLSGVDMHDMALDKLVRTPGALSSIIRLTVHALRDELTVVKSRQVIGGDTAGVTKLPVEPGDIATAHRALERLATVNEALRQP